jgi:hypothetical protein
MQKDLEKGQREVDDVVRCSIDLEVGGNLAENYIQNHQVVV